MRSCSNMATVGRSTNKHCHSGNWRTAEASLWSSRRVETTGANGRCFVVWTFIVSFEMYAQLLSSAALPEVCNHSFLPE